MSVLPCVTVIVRSSTHLSGLALRIGEARIVRHYIATVQTKRLAVRCASQTAQIAFSLLNCVLKLAQQDLLCQNSRGKFVKQGQTRFDKTGGKGRRSSYTFMLDDLENITPQNSRIAEEALLGNIEPGSVFDTQRHQLKRAD